MVKEMPRAIFPPGLLLSLLQAILIGLAVDAGYISSIEDPASTFITEWSNDERSSITIKNLLDMRSGLTPMCFLFEENEIGECKTAAGAASGGNIIYSNDQMAACHI
jgi:CubicO group peptidase (beta-lactamase class C family)